jgi:AraC-like DNA-binding protein
VELDQQPYWINFRRSRAVSGGQSEYWYIELRPLEANELPTVGVVEDSRIAQAIAYLHEEYPRSPSLAQVARAVHTSPFHFHRLFSRYVGVSPKQYLQRKQLQVAKWMLRATRLPIGTIATRSGFASHGHFTSTFHRIIGVSPSDYRDSARV